MAPNQRKPSDIETVEQSPQQQIRRDKLNSKSEMTDNANHEVKDSKKEDTSIPGFIRKRKISFEKTYGKMTLREFEGADCTGATLICGFPSGVSLTSVLVTNYISDQLKLPVIGDIVSEHIQPRCYVENDKASNACRILGDNRIVLILSEYQMNERLMNNMISAILDFSQRWKIASIVTIEGLPIQGSTEKEADSKNLRFLSTNEEFCKILHEQLGHKGINEALITGFTAGIISEVCAGKANDVTALLAPVSPRHPDAVSAVPVVKALEQLIPNIKIDTKPLEEKAKELEKGISKAISEIEGQSKRNMQFMYG
mmetsp:Transcript_19503/g.27206  ORF Transcript_19503/g.27206 Transcript_19503/m.27206 type:complete len:313 (+) Transcript_19503:59-997(+)